MTDRLDEIRARLSDITQPTGSDTWLAEQHLGVGWEVYTGELSATSADIASYIFRKADAQFIAAAPGDISFLLGEVERLTAEPRDAELLVLREQAHSEAVRGNEAEAQAAELRAEIDRLTAERDGLQALLDPDNEAAVERLARALYASYGATRNMLAALREACSFIPQTGDHWAAADILLKVAAVLPEDES